MSDKPNSSSQGKRKSVFDDAEEVQKRRVSGTPASAGPSSSRPPPVTAATRDVTASQGQLSPFVSKNTASVQAYLASRMPKHYAPHPQMKPGDLLVSPNDSRETVKTKLANADRVKSEGYSLAATSGTHDKTHGYLQAADTILVNMSPNEAWMFERWAEQSAGGKHVPSFLPHINWAMDRMPVATKASATLKRYDRRAQALNLLYLVDWAVPENVVWFAHHHVTIMPLLEAMTRVVGQERNLHLPSAEADAERHIVRKARARMQELGAKWKANTVSLDFTPEVPHRQVDKRTALGRYDHHPKPRTGGASAPTRDGSAEAGPSISRYR